MTLFNMKIITGIFIAMAVAVALHTGCTAEGTLDEERLPRNMTLTVSRTGDIRISLAGTGTATVDWGMGTATESKILVENRYTDFTFNYPGGAVRTIEITGMNITGVECVGAQMTAINISDNMRLVEINVGNNLLDALDVSHNTALRELECAGNNLNVLDVTQNTSLRELECGYNDLTALDVSKNIALTELDVRGNEMDAAALNALFEGLPENAATEKVVSMGGNPGEGGCNRDIATGRGWRTEE